MSRNRWSRQETDRHASLSVSEPEPVPRRSVLPAGGISFYSAVKSSPRATPQEEQEDMAALQRAKPGCSECSVQGARKQCFPCPRLCQLARDPGPSEEQKRESADAKRKQSQTTKENDSSLPSERKQTTQGRDGRTARRHHTGSGILRAQFPHSSQRPRPLS